MCNCRYLGCNIRAIYNRVIETRFTQGVTFCIFLHVVFVYNTRRLMSQMNMTKKNLKNLVLNAVHTVLGGFLRVLGITLGVTLSDDESCDGYRGSLALGYENIGEADTGECTGAENIFSIARILDESFIDPMFVESAEMG